MADNLITTNITANADFSSLRTQLAAVTAQLVKLQETTAGTNAKLANQIAVMNKSFAETMRSTGQFSSHFVSLTSDVEKFGRNLDRGRLKLNDYFNAWNGHTKKTGTLIRDLAKQQVMLEQAVVQPLGKNAQGLMQYNVMVAKGLDVIKNKMAIARQEAAIMNKVMLDGSNQLINWGKNTQWAGRQLTVGLTVPLVAFGAAAQKAFREADQELVRLTKVYGGLAAVSSADLAKVRKDVSATAKEIASSYGIAYKDTIALAADLAATGQQGNELLEATRQTSRLAILGEVERQEAMKATLAIQNAFKQNTEELTESIDFLNAVENQTSTSLADLVEAIPKAGPVVKSLGGDVKDLALYLTAMKEGGVNASEGANAIKSAMASLINPTKVAREMFTGFGIDIDNIVTSNAGNLTQTIVDLQSALDGLDPLSKSRAIEQLFGKFQYARMSALFENLGKSGSQTLQVMDLMKASVSDLAGISERELKMMTESASGQFKRAWATVQADLAQVGDQFLRISTKVLQVVDGIIRFFQNLPGPVKTFLNALGGITAIAGPLIMLTGVMGNFIGYVIKGIFHLRQLAKGGQGFRLLTPEIIAADAAAKGLASTFFSDTEATMVLKNAVDTLTASFTNLELKANSAKVAVQPAITTVAGGVLAAGGAGQRSVDKSNPLIGAPYTRDMSHLIPSGMPQAGSIFGTVPGAKPVNIRIGSNPQAYMNQDMPKIPGVTSINGTSTGIVAAEAAKWHAMTAAIAMQSEAEIKLLKTEVMATGTVTSSLSDSYKALLPQFTEITQLAAAETQAIVAQLQASKITVDQARAKVIQLNATVEAMLIETTNLTAAGMGRVANLTTVPLTSQPVVDPLTGKSNMKEMFHKGSTKTIADRIARALGGVRTSGAGYNIETTKPKFEKGGIVPGTGNTDTYHTTAEAGSFVINKAGTEANMPVIQDLLGGRPVFRNDGGQVPVVLTPGEAVVPPDIAQKNMPLMYALNGGPGNTGFGLSEGGNPDWSTWKKILRLQERYQNAFDPEKGNGGGWQKELTHRSVMHDATVLNNKGIPIDDAVRIASDNYRQAMLPKPDGAMGENGTIDKKAWRDIRQAQFDDAVKLVRDANSNVDPKNRRQLNTYAAGRIGASDARPTAEMLDHITRNPDKFGGEVFVKRLFKDLGFEQKDGKWVIDKYGKVSAKNLHSTHTSPDAKWGYKAAGNFGQAFWGEADLNLAANDVRSALRIKGQKGSTFSYFPDEVLMTDKAIALQDKSWLKRFGTTVPQAILDRKKGIISLPQLFKLMRRGAASRNLGFRHLEVAANKGGEIPGQFAQRLFGGGGVKGLFLGMPKSIKNVEAQRAAKAAMEKANAAVKDSRFSNRPVTEYDDLLEPTSGRSFPVPGIGGIYSKGGDKVFVKPVLDEKAALAELRATQIARDVHGLKSPDQKVVVIKDPTDPTGKRKILALESKYDEAFAKQDGKFTSDQYFKQLVASALRGDKDLGRGNLSGNILADVGPAGVFGSASGLRDYSANIPSMKDQAMINLLGVKGSSAKKFFAESTLDIPKSMTPDQYHLRMLAEIEDALPKLKKTVSSFDLNSEEKVVYNAMIKRLSDARSVNWGELHGVHSAVKISEAKPMTPAAIAKMLAADELKRRQRGASASLSDNAFKTAANGFAIGGLIGNITKGKAMHRIGAGFGPTGAPKPSMYESAPWGVNSLSIGMGEKLFGKSGLTKRAQNFLYDKFAAELAKEMPYGYTKNASGSLIKALEPDVVDSVMRSAAGSLLSAPEARRRLSDIDRDILRKKYANWESKKDTPVTESLKQLIFKLEGREKGGPVAANTPYVVGEKGPEIFVPRNSGGIIPNKYGVGGMIKPILMSIFGGFGGQALGKMSGIPGGEMIGMMLGSMLGNVGGMSGMGQKASPTIAGRGKMTTPFFSTTKAVDTLGPQMANGATGLSKYGIRLQQAAAGGSKFAGILAKVGFAATRANLAIGLGVTAIAMTVKRWKDHNEHLRIGMMQYGLTAEAAKKAGLKFTDYNTKLGETVKNIQALRERNQLLYESMQDAGMPISMTIEEYKKLRKEVKSTYADQIKLINQTKGSGNTKRLAEDLKVQLMAAGLSAEEATKKIWAMFKISEKAREAASYTVGNSGFNKIETKQDAAAKAVARYERAASEGGKEGAAQVNTGLTAIDTGIQDMIEKSKKAAREDKSGNTKVLTQYEAQEKMLKRLNNLELSKTKLTEDTINEMAKQNPVIKEIATEQDTVVSLWEKMNLAAKGFTGDLSKLGSEAVSTLSKVADAISAATVSANKTGLLKEQYATLDKLTAQQKALMKAAKGQSVAQQISTRDQLRNLQKQIDANNKLADSRLKALDAAKQEGDLARELEKKRAAYDAAVATGNTSEAQQLSLDIKGIQSTMQYNSQKTSIENARDAANKPLQAKMDKINANQEKMADNARLAGESLGKLNDKIATQRQKIDDVNTAMTTLRLNAAAAGKSLADYIKYGTDENKKAGKQDAADLVGSAKSAGVKIPTTSGGQYVGSTFVANKKSVGSQALDLITTTEDAVTKGLAANGMKIGQMTGDIWINGKKMDVGQIPPTKTKAGESFGASMSTYKANEVTLKEAGRRAITDRQSKQYTGAAGDQYYLFKHGTKTYAVEKTGAQLIHSFDEALQKVGKVVRAGYGTMKLNPNVPTIVGDRGPEMAFGGMIIPNMAKIPYASPRYDVNKAALQMGAAPSQAGTTIQYTQHIHASAGMNEDQLVMKAKVAAYEFLQDSIKTNAKMVGSSKNVRINT
jgi:TP901 family phage tail tape measure protein